MRRRAAGIIALLLLCAGLAIYVWQPNWENAVPLAAICVRVGLVLGAIWLAYPELKRVPGWLGPLCAGALLAIAVRPRLAIFIVPLTIAILLLRPRKRKPPAQKPTSA